MDLAMSPKWNAKTKATSESGVADPMSQYVKGTFQPLQEPDFNYSHFNHIDQEWLSSQPSLNNSAPLPIPANMPCTVNDLNPSNITWPSSFFCNQPYQDCTSRNTNSHHCSSPTPTYTSTKKTLSHPPTNLEYQSTQTGQKT